MEQYITIVLIGARDTKMNVPLTNPQSDTNLQELKMDAHGPICDCDKRSLGGALISQVETCQKYKEGRVLMDDQTLKAGEKKDEGKPRFELLPYEVLAGVARILTAGARKYDDRNWEKGIAYGRCFGAAMRHLSAYWTSHLDGRDGINHADGEESHLDHAITELMFLSAYEKRGMTQFDDRPGSTPKIDCRQG